jgi:alpha-tubulin suppressor-like RCC1 family protein
MDGQYYDQLAREAAESGLAKAQGCLQQSASIPTWTNAKPLRPWTNCNGDAYGSETCPDVAATNTKSVCGVLVSSGIRTSFSVGLPTTSTSGVQSLSATSAVYLIRTTDSTIRRTINGSAGASVGANVAISYTSISNAQPNTFGLGNPLAAVSFSFGADGNVYGLGYNGFGILGNGTLTNASMPVKFQLPGTLKAKSVGVNALSAGMSAFVITADGQVYGAGANNYGQLGNGATATRQSTPVRFNLPVSVKAAKMFVHGESTFVITETGAVYAAGAGTYGQLGNGAAVNSSTPVLMSLPAGEKASMIEADAHSVYIVAESGKAYFTGANDWSQSGNGTLGGQINTPIRFYPNAGDAGQPTVRQVVTDGASGWALLSDGSIWGVGRTSDGQLGNSAAPIGSGSYSSQFRNFELGAERAVQMATDYADLVVLTESGKVYGAGRNDSGELGCGNTTRQTVPCQALLPANVKGAYIINAGDGLVGASDRYTDNTLVLTTDGKAYAMGDNYYGQLGIGAAGSPQSTPQLMALPSGIEARSVRAGAGTAVVLGSDNRVYAVGNNNYGQLGTGNTTNLPTLTATNYLNLRPAVLF